MSGTRAVVNSEIGESRSIERGMRASDSPRDGSSAAFPLPLHLAPASDNDLIPEAEVLVPRMRLARVKAA